MRFRLWAQVFVALGINLTLLSALAAFLIAQQTRTGVQSFLYAPARERIRELGMQVEEEFPGKPEAERSAWLARLQQGTGVTLAVYNDRGLLVAGPDLAPPASVIREILRDDNSRPARDFDNPPPPPKQNRAPRRKRPPMFFLRAGDPSRYWFGYHFPITMQEGRPPVRHTLAVAAPSLLTAPLLIDWYPLAGGAAMALVLTTLCWVPVVRRVTRSIQIVRDASAEIAHGRFEIAIPVRSGDELGDLAVSIRQMAEQLAQLIHGQNRFLADVAHELCAPLARIQLSAGILEQRAPTGQIELVQRLERDVSHMSALVSDLLSFTKGTVRKPELIPLQVNGLVRIVALQEQAEGSEVTVDVPEALIALADAEYLQRALANLIRNAIRYAGNAGPIRVTAQTNGDRVRILVQDSGPGLPQADLDAVFSPFYRPDTVRTPGTGGAGLGLAIVKGCVEACRGSVSCRNRTPSGLEVTIELESPQKG